MARSTVEDHIQREIEKVDEKIRAATRTVEELQERRRRLMKALGAAKGES